MSLFGGRNKVSYRRHKVQFWILYFVCVSLLQAVKVNLLCKVSQEKKKKKIAQNHIHVLVPRLHSSECLFPQGALHFPHAVFHNIIIKGLTVKKKKSGGTHPWNELKLTTEVLKTVQNLLGKAIWQQLSMMAWLPYLGLDSSNKFS